MRRYPQENTRICVFSAISPRGLSPRTAASVRSKGQNGAQQKLLWCAPKDKMVRTKSCSGSQQRTKWCAAKVALVRSRGQNGAQQKIKWCAADVSKFSCRPRGRFRAVRAPKKLSAPRRGPSDYPNFPPKLNHRIVMPKPSGQSSAATLSSAAPRPRRVTFTMLQLWSMQRERTS